jgi:hypothetical protein
MKTTFGTEEIHRPQQRPSINTVFEQNSETKYLVRQQQFSIT